MATTSFRDVALAIQEELDRYKVADPATIASITPRQIRLPVEAKIKENLTDLRVELKAFISALFELRYPQSSEEDLLPVVNGHDSRDRGSAISVATKQQANDSKTSRDTTVSAKTNGSQVTPKKRKRDNDGDASFARSLQAHEDAKNRSSRSGKASKPAAKKRTPAKKSKAVVDESDDGSGLERGEPKKKKKRVMNPNSGFNVSLSRRV